MDIGQIRILKAIDEFGSINAASEHLYMAKSAISTSIKQVELEFGFKLLDRTSYRVKLSPKAKMYLEKANAILKLSSELDGFRKQLSENIESSIKISSTVLYNLENYIRLIKNLNKKFPSTTIYLEREVLSGEKMLLDGTVDIAITETNADITNIETKKISEVKMPLVISANHEFLQSLKNKKTFEELQKFPQIILRSTFPEASNFGGIYNQAPHWNVSDHHTKLELIKNGLGWGRMPDYLVKKDLDQGRLIALTNIEKPMTINIYLARRKNYPYGKVADFIWQADLQRYD